MLTELIWSWQVRRFQYLHWRGCNNGREGHVCTSVTAQSRFLVFGVLVDFRTPPFITVPRAFRGR